MRQVILSDLAGADLLNIGEYIAQINPDAAFRLMERFREVQPAGSVSSSGTGTHRHTPWLAFASSLTSI